MLSGAITPLFVGLLRLNTRIGLVKVDDMIVPYLSGYPKLSLSSPAGKGRRSEWDYLPYTY